MRFGLGPVFVYEWLRASRRWQLYAVRSAFVAVILGGLYFMWSSQYWPPEGPQLPQIAAFGRRIYTTTVVIELTLILLAAPAATAGAVCLDKSRGTMLHIMATDLTDSEIVLGKLLAGLIPMAGLVFCVLPVQMLVSLFGGVDPEGLIGATAVILATGVLTCTLAFTLSVWGRKSHEVLSATYLILIVWLALPIFIFIAARGAVYGNLPPDVLYRAAVAINPYTRIHRPFMTSGWSYAAGVVAYSIGCLVVSMLLARLSIRSIRAATVNHQRTETAKARRRWSWVRLPRLLPEPSLEANPVLWREWSRSRPSGWALAIWLAYAGVGIMLTFFSLTEMARSVRRSELGVAVALFQVGVGLLLLIVRAAATLTEERIRGSLDVLMTTPMSTLEILAGKWWGTFRIAPWLAALPTFIGVIACLHTGRWGGLVLMIGMILAHAAAVTSAGIAMAVWVARPGRAIAASVGFYIVLCGIFLIAAMFLDTGPRRLGELAAMGSPVWGATAATLYVMGFGPSRLLEQIPFWLAFWGCFHTFLAMGFFLAAALTFDRCLGRSSVGWRDDLRSWSWGDLLPGFRREGRDFRPPAPAPRDSPIAEGAFPE